MFTLRHDEQQVCEHVNVIGFLWWEKQLKQIGQVKKSFNWGVNGIRIKEYIKCVVNKLIQMIVYIITEPYFCVVFSTAFGTTSSLCQYHFAFNDSLYTINEFNLRFTNYY